MQACIPPTDLHPLLLWADDDGVVDASVRACTLSRRTQWFYRRRHEQPIFFAIVTFNLPMIQRLLWEGQGTPHFYFTRDRDVAQHTLIIFLRIVHRHRYAIEVRKRAQPILEALLTVPRIRDDLWTCMYDWTIGQPCIWPLLPTMERTGVSLLSQGCRQVSGLYMMGASEHGHSGLRELQEQRFFRAQALHECCGYKKALPNELWLILFTMLTHLPEKAWLEVREARQRWLRQLMQEKRKRKRQFCRLCRRGPCEC